MAKVPKENESEIIDARALFDKALTAVQRQQTKDAIKKARQKARDPEAYNAKRARHKRTQRANMTPEARHAEGVKRWARLKGILPSPERRASENKRKNALEKRKREQHKSEPPQFIALDGEGVTRRPSGQHDYVLLGCSDGRTLDRWSRGGLSTRECLDFLLETKREHPKAVFVGFSTGYDINMIVGDCDVDTLALLQAGEAADWNGYRMRYFPGKSFWVARIEGDDIRESMTLWDVWGFFQSSFVNALQEWKIGDVATVAQIAGMKESRGVFKADERSEITGYCIRECELLVELMIEVARTLIDVDLYLARWDGAGAVAGAMLGKHGIRRYTRMADESAMQDILLRAYFGGRVETFGVGVVTDECYAFDINSAYPAQTQHLPNCVGTWERATAYHENTAPPYGVYRVRWKGTGDQQIGPFPYRIASGDVYWPRSGEGWYHAVEVKAAIECCPGYEIEVKEGFVFTPVDDARPFAYIPSVYEERLAYKSAGDPRNIILKLGLNATYGKLAQTVGAFGRAPAYQSFMYAGMITAGTRAAMLRAMSTVDPINLVVAATDGIFTREPLNVPQSKALGMWDSKTIEAGLLVAQTGVMVSPERRHVRTRGFSKGGIDYAAFYEAWTTKYIAAQVTIKETRFHGLGRALQEGMRDWRRWVESDHTLGFSVDPKKSTDIAQYKTYKPKRYPFLYGNPNQKYGDQFPMWALLFCVDMPPGEMSAAYQRDTEFNEQRKVGEQHMSEQPDIIDSLWP